MISTLHAAPFRRRFLPARLRLLCLLLFLAAGTGAFARQPSYFMLGEDVFEGVQIYDVIQDDAMNYWIATDNGVYRYDYYTFSKAECEGAQGLSVFGFVKNKTGTIYCYNLNNQVLQIRNGVYSVFYELKPEERSSDIYLSVTPQNELLVLTKTALLFSEDGKALPVARPRPSYYGFPFLTAGGQVISHIANSDSLLVYENREFKTVRLRFDGGPLSGVLKFFTLSGKTYALTTAGKEIYAFNSTDYSLELRAETELNQSREVFRVYNENNQVWVAGVISGVRVLSGDDTLRLSEKYYTGYLISDVYQDLEGNLLLSTFNRGMLVIPNTAIPDVLDFPGSPSLVSVHNDGQLGMLMGTANGLLLSYKDGAYNTLSGSGSRPLQAVFSWPGFPFVLFDDGNINALEKSTGEIIPVITRSLKDAVLVDDSTVYMAMNTGLAKVTWKGGTRLEFAYVDSLRLRCYAIEFSRAGQLLYIATSDGVKTMDRAGKISAVLLDGKQLFANDIASDGTSTYMATRDGVVVCNNGKAGATIKTVIRDKPVELLKIAVQDGRISGTTTEGFAVFDMSGKALVQLNRMHGFSTNRIYDFEISGTDTWICHSGGVQKLTAGMLNLPIPKPMISISAVLVDDRPVSALSEAGTYTSDERKFRFVLSSPTLRNSENIRYHYQLKGYDETWIVAGYSDHEVVYNSLAPGDYVFSVKAENNGVFSETVSYAFSISAPFYSRWWFSVLVGLVLLLVVSLVYKYRLQVQHRKAQLANELHASRLTAIQSQMNPHFIFNALNSIQDLVLKGDVDNSYTFITKFSNLVRRTLNYSDKDFIDFDQEITLIELYLSLEKLRFKEDLTYTIDAAGIEDIMIPPMLIQPFIENALVHGLLHKEGKKQITIRFQLSEMLTCTIEDNGVGRAKAKEIKDRQRSGYESFSGQAIRKRFSILGQVFDDEFGHTYEDLYDGGTPAGTRVTLSMPVKRRL